MRTAPRPGQPERPPFTGGIPATARVWIALATELAASSSRALSVGAGPQVAQGFSCDCQGWDCDGGAQAAPPSQSPEQAKVVTSQAGSSKAFPLREYPAPGTACPPAPTPRAPVHQRPAYL